MGAFFQVEVDTIARYVATLREAQEHLAALPSLFSSDEAVLGNDKLNQAAEDFRTSWQYGAKQLGEVVGHTTAAVQDVHGAYVGTDAAVQAAMSSLQQPLGIIDEAADELTRRP